MSAQKISFETFAKRETGKRRRRQTSPATYVMLAASKADKLIAHNLISFYFGFFLILDYSSIVFFLYQSNTRFVAYPLQGICAIE